MKILVFNGSPRPHGNTAAMVEAFAEGARENGHQVDVVNVCQKKIAGCMACEYCHQKIPAMNANAFRKTICRKYIHCWMRRR